MNKVIAFLRLVGFDNNHRWYCGYVGVKDDSMLPKSIQGSIDMLDDYSNSLDAKISVHGGVGEAEAYSAVIAIPANKTIVKH